MAHVVKDRIKETTTTTGTGPFTVAGAMTGFSGFASACSVGDTFRGTIQAVDANGNPTGDWQSGTFTYSAANQLTTLVVESSSTGSAVSFSAGTKQVWIGETAKLAEPLQAFSYNSGTKVVTTTGSISVEREDGTPADISVTNYGVAGGMGVMHMRMANGTKASPTGITAGQAYGGLGGRAYHSGGSFQGPSSPTAIHFIASEDQTATAWGGYISFWTTPKLSITRREVAHITDNGTLWVRDAGTFDPKNAAQTKPFSDAILLASGSSGSTSVASVNYAGAGAGFRGGTCGGTPASPTATTIDSLVCFLGGQLFDGTAWSSGTRALIGFKAGQAITSSNQGMYITFETTPLNSTTRAEVGRFDPDGNFLIQQVGRGHRVKEGSNAKQGTATLSGGSVVVSNTSVTANSRIFLTGQVDGGTPGWLRVSARTAGASFTITSSSGTDASTVAYEIFEPA
ncbi:MAG: hypothetical protein A2Y38_16575 [Spirochaetes bacterium GWB1_59_5]|nr:MAG: hypothetical protein A2Y38_16575 [Spirochaetes bacterium GWB1_59_5]